MLVEELFKKKSVRLYWVNDYIAKAAARTASAGACSASASSEVATDKNIKSGAVDKNLKSGAADKRCLRRPFDNSHDLAEFIKKRYF